MAIHRTPAVAYLSLGRGNSLQGRGQTMASRAGHFSHDQNPHAAAGGRRDQAQPPSFSADRRRTPAVAQRRASASRKTGEHRIRRRRVRTAVGPPGRTRDAGGGRRPGGGSPGRDRARPGHGGAGARDARRVRRGPDGVLPPRGRLEGRGGRADQELQRRRLVPAAGTAREHDRPCAGGGQELRGGRPLLDVPGLRHVNGSRSSHPERGRGDPDRLHYRCAWCRPTGH